MKKREGLVLIVLSLIIMILVSYPAICRALIQKKQVQFYFYDEITNCTLSGYVFSGGNLLGESINGRFNLTYENYIENFNEQDNISLFGVLGECFSSYLFFDKYWKSFEIDERYFTGNSLFNFKTKVDIHNPSRRELMGFVQPKKVSSELSKINLKRKDTLDDLSSINEYLNNKIIYVKDWNFTDKTNYWQIPEETLRLGRGDCEDFSTALLSLFLSYNESLNCYNIIFSSHVATFCKVDGYYAYYDQGRTEIKKKIENSDFSRAIKNLKDLKKDYFEHYGFNDSTTSVHFAFNNNQFVEFKSEDEFINWQYNVRKINTDVLQELKAESVEAEAKYPGIEEELAVIRQSQEMPTFKGFLKDNSIILLILGAIFTILIFILIRINFRRK